MDEARENIATLIDDYKAFENDVSDEPSPVIPEEKPPTPKAKPAKAKK